MENSMEVPPKIKNRTAMWSSNFTSGCLPEENKNANSKRYARTSLVVQWLRIHLSMQGTWVQSLVWEDPTCHRATKPMDHNYWAWALEPVSHNYWAHALQLLKPAQSRARVPQLLSLCAATTEAHASRPCAPQQEKPPQCETCALQRRVAPTRRN